MTIRWFQPEEGLQGTGRTARGGLAGHWEEGLQGTGRRLRSVTVTVTVTITVTITVTVTVTGLIAHWGEACFAEKLMLTLSLTDEELGGHALT